MSATIKNAVCEKCESRGKCLFANIEHCYLDEVSDTKNVNFYKKGSIIFHENNYPLGLYGIFEGKVKIYKTTDMGKDHILRLAKNGDVLGYRSLISGDKYEATAESLEDTYVCFIPKTYFMELMRKSKNLTARIMEVLSVDLKAAENKVADMAQKNVKERVAETVLMLKNFYGMEEDERTIKVNLSREDLANLVGTATETLIRSLSEFKKHQVLGLKGKKIEILNYKVLKSLANNYD